MVGSKTNCKVKYMPQLNIIWNPDKFQILGVWFSTNLKECEHLNYDEKLSEVKLLFKIWLKRLITPAGRVAVLKSLILFKLVHLWILLPNKLSGTIKAAIPQSKASFVSNPARPPSHPTTTTLHT